MNAKRADELKEQGNECVKKENYMEAIIHYTHAIKLDPSNHLIFSNRSLAFLKVQQYYLALDDAKQAIQLQPKWTKGYFRKGEVEFAVGNYNDAVMSYNKAMVLDATDVKVRDAISKTRSAMNKERKANARLPWKFAAAGGGMGLLIVIADQYLAKEPSITYVVLQLLLISVFAALGYVIALGYRFLLNSQKSSLLEAPIDLLSEMEGKPSRQTNPEESSQDTSESGKRHRKGGTGAARQRYKQGKT
ncbi:hsp70-Hsp90 organizing protein 1-like [Haliotis rufescens]|uniref:hsp70-Hsp90 organizing protein 1-like n=1 Tax=Haliotis rufescens TaxID=6454 RepID=UPI001EB02DFF|nr:hsp70-Hsp90 organizing protein 1-like [Haliotis rufescens]